MALLILFSHPCEVSWVTYIATIQITEVNTLLTKRSEGQYSQWLSSPSGIPFH